MWCVLLFSSNLAGGGITGQAGAIKHGLANALVRYDPYLKPALKKREYCDPYLKPTLKKRECCACDACDIIVYICWPRSPIYAYISLLLFFPFIYLTSRVQSAC